MKDVMEYKGYVGSVQYSAEDEILHGKLEGIRDLITYEGSDIASLKQSFHDSVDDYLETCAEAGRAPEIPFRGSFNVRVGSELHKRAALYATRENKKLNTIVGDAIAYYLEAMEGSTCKPDTKSVVTEQEAGRIGQMIAFYVERNLTPAHWATLPPGAVYRQIGTFAQVTEEQGRATRECFPMLTEQFCTAS